MILTTENIIFNVTSNKKAKTMEGFMTSVSGSKKANITAVVHRKGTEDITYKLTDKQFDILKANYCEFIVPKGLLQKAERINLIAAKEAFAQSQRKKNQQSLDEYKDKIKKAQDQVKRETQALIDITNKLVDIKKKTRTIEKYLGYRFHNKQLLAQAFIAKTSDTKHLDNSGPLEFVGDRVLYTIVTKDMSDTYLIKNDDMIKVTNMSSFSNCVTRFTTNTCFMEHIVGTPLENFMIISGAHSKKVYANLFESLIGAVAIDSNYNIRKVTKVYNNLMK